MTNQRTPTVEVRPVAVVTGAGSGIGAAIARELGGRGHYVVVTDVDVERAAAVARGIEAAESRRLDVTDPHECDAVASAVASSHGRLDVWVSNAGVSTMARFVEISREDLARTFAVNTYGVFWAGQAAARAMIALGRPGRIINTASMAAKQGRVPYLAHYVASKFAVVGLTQAMAFELAPHAITVNAVCPGFVATPMQERELGWEARLRGVDANTVRQLWINDTPLARLETPEDVATVVAFLASDDAAFITGESIAVNGGAFMD